jgi:hypothetical protein
VLERLFPSATRQNISRDKSMAVHDRVSEISPGLDELLPSDRLVALHALSIAFPTLLGRPDWKTRVGGISAAVNPTADELSDILISATRIAGYLQIYMAE